MEEQTVTSRLEEIEKLLENYENRIGLGNILYKEEPQLDISKEEMAVLSPEALDLLRWQYMHYTLFLQKTINKHQARLVWADTNLKRFLEKNCQEYAGWKWEERQANCLADNIYAQKLDLLKLNSKLVIERTAFICNKISFLCEIMKDISYAKRRSRTE